MSDAVGGTTLDVSDEPGQPWRYGQVPVDPLPVEPAPGTETGGGGAGCWGAPDELVHCVAPALPLEPTAGPVEPVAPPPGDTPVGRTTFGFHRAARGAVETEVIVGYGDSSSCPDTGVVPLVEETDEVVIVTLEAVPRVGVGATTSSGAAKCGP